MLRWSIAAALVIATVGLYWPVADHAFVEFDDPLYVTANANVQQGVNLENLGWAFRSSDAYIWHPLTWLSYMLDFDLHGIDRAGPWLLTNVALHALNAALLFTALLALLGASRRQGSQEARGTPVGSDYVWACAGVAALFALHPVQVESVAWVSARKELLAGTFLMLTLHAYAAYVRSERRSALALVVVTMCLGSMAKGSHIGLPLLLLLLDCWPLRRLRLDASEAGRRAAWPRVREKIPLLLVSLGTVAVNLTLVGRSYNVFVTDPPLSSRLGTIAVNLVTAVGRFAWPTQLAIVYPTPLQVTVPAWPLARIAVAFAVLLLVSVLALRLAASHGYLLTGWFWFLGMLLPMSGLLPAGIRTPHDHYLYVPMIGLAITACFGVRALVAGVCWRERAALVVALAAVAACGSGSRQQIQVWQDSATLFDHALAVTERNTIVHYSKGTMLARQGHTEQAIAELEAALRIHPYHADANNNLGYLLVHSGRSEQGILHLKRAVFLRPEWERALVNLADAQLRSGDVEGAIETLTLAVERVPESAQLRDLLVRARRRSGP